MKRITAVLFLILLLLPIVTTSAFAKSYTPPFSVNAEGVYMANLDSNMIIYEKNAQEKIPCDVLSQLMTVILAIENIEDPANTMITMKGYIQDEMSSAVRRWGVRLGGLYKGETLSAEKLMYAVTLQCANEAAYMLGDYIADGSDSYFAALMNHRAKEIGANDTNFTNAAGIPDEKAYTTAYDAYLIARHALTLPLFRELIEATRYEGGPTNINESLLWTTSNKFIMKSSDYYDPSVTTVKVCNNPDTGVSSAIVFAKKNGYTYALSLMNCRGENESEWKENRDAVYEETEKLLDWAFKTFKVKTLLEQGKSFQEVPLKLCSGKDYLRLMSAHDFQALIPDEIEASSIKFNLKLPSYVNAPVKKGQLIGEAELILSGEVIGKVAIVSSESAEASHLLIVLENLKDLVRSYKFKLVICFFIVAVAFYIIYTIIKNRSRTRYRKRR